MIIFGTRGLTLTGKPAPFFCPQCDREGVYRRKTIRRFFTLYFIPLIPLDKLEEYIQCQTCRGNFRVDVIHYDPRAEREAQQLELQRDFRTILMHFAGMSARRDDAFLETIAALHSEFDGVAISPEAVAEDLKLTRKDIELETGRLRGHLSDRGRETLIRCAHRAVAADGHVTAEAEAAVAGLAQALGMTEAHYRGVLGELGAAPAMP